MREAVFAVLVVALRLDRKDALSAATSPSTVANAPATGYDTAKGGRALLTDAAAAAAAAAAEEARPLPLLPVEMSIYMMRFFKRSRWDAEDA